VVAAEPVHRVKWPPLVYTSELVTDLKQSAWRFRSRFGSTVAPGQQGDVMPPTPSRGDTAPDFTLPGIVSGKRSDYTLSEQHGHPIVLAFYPGDETLVCTKQLCSYQDDLSAFSDLGAELWGISSQSIDSHEAFQRNRNLTFPLLADESNQAFEAYGLGLGLARRRALFVVDSGGIIAWSHVSRLGLSYQKADAIEKVLKELRPVA
jgi:thioredoxin-dependent peroxiredoxin